MQVGAAVALINTGLRPAQMAHSLAVARPALLLYDASLEETVLTAVAAMPGGAGAGLRLARLDSASLDGATEPGTEPAFPADVGPHRPPDGASLDASAGLLSSSRAAYPRARRAGIGFRDPWGYIYTSGTTGLPKAAVLTSQRFLVMSSVLSSIAGVTPADVLYTALPLFHSAGALRVRGGGERPRRPQ